MIWYLTFCFSLNALKKNSDTKWHTFFRFPLFSSLQFVNSYGRSLTPGTCRWAFILFSLLPACNYSVAKLPVFLVHFLHNYISHSVIFVLPEFSALSSFTGMHAYACHGDYCNIWILFRCSDMYMYVMLSKSFFPRFTLRFSLCLVCPPPVYLTTCTLFLLCLSCFIFFLYSSFSSIYLFLVFLVSFFDFSFLFLSQTGRGLLDKAETQNRKIQCIIMFFNLTCQVMCFV